MGLKKRPGSKISVFSSIICDFGIIVRQDIFIFAVTKTGFEPMAIDRKTGPEISVVRVKTILSIDKCPGNLNTKSVKS